MLAGRLDRRITIQHKTVAQNGLGEEVETWADLVTVFSSWRRASARETLAAAEVAAAVTDVFEIRYSIDVAGVNPGDHRLVYETRTYNIIEVAEIDRRVGLRISAAARADE